VTVNYRTNGALLSTPITSLENACLSLTVFGFPSSPELPITGHNLGFLDQRMGLYWTQRNIAAFGGSPDKVTIVRMSKPAAAYFTRAPDMAPTVWRKCGSILRRRTPHLVSCELHAAVPRRYCRVWADQLSYPGESQLDPSLGRLECRTWVSRQLC